MAAGADAAASGLTGNVRPVLVPPQRFADANALGSAAADLIVDRLSSRNGKQPFLLGCPGGRSPESTYTALARQAAARRLDLRQLVIVMMDEYVERSPDGRLRSVSAAEPHSCRRFGHDRILGQLNAALARAGVASYAVPSENLWVPDPERPEQYEDRLSQAGGVDLFLLASGASDGHVAFNSPGAPADSRTRVVPLPDSTRRDNLATFPSFGGRLAGVPRYGVTVGIATIREQSAEVILLAHGADKQQTVRRLTAAATYQPDWPATVLADCRSPSLLVDAAAWPRAATEPPIGSLSR